MNDLIQKEYKDTEGFPYRSSGRWQCIGGVVKDNDKWLQSMVFIQEEEHLVECNDRIRIKNFR